MDVAGNPGLSMRKCKHGKTGTKEHNIWMAMRQRCFNKNSAQYSYYGGRGITIYKEWADSFTAFLSYMGECPDGCSIDRLDCNGNYEPGNVRWATNQEQAFNKRNTVFVEHNGVNVPLMSLSAEYSISEDMLRSRVRRQGWGLDKALRTQNMAQRSTVTYRGQTKTVAAWCRELGLEYAMIHKRRKRHSVEYAFETPKEEKYCKNKFCKAC